MERREQARYTPSSPIQVFNNLNDELIGTVVNISEGGLFLTTNKTLQDGAVFQLRLQSEDGKLEISAGANCLWSSEASTPDTHWAGFQIIDISEETTRQLRSYIKGLSTEA